MFKIRIEKSTRKLKADFHGKEVGTKGDIFHSAGSLVKAEAGGRSKEKNQQKVVKGQR